MKSGKGNIKRFLQKWIGGNGWQASTPVNKEENKIFTLKCLDYVVETLALTVLL